MLDSRAIPGGGAATEELLGPGYLIDSCSTGHTLIQTNPLLTGGRARAARSATGSSTWSPTRSRTSRSPTASSSPRGWTSSARSRRSRASRRPTARPTGGCWPTTTRSSTSSRRGDLQPGRLRAVGRAAAARAPEGQRVAAAAGAERLGRDPARVRVPARAGASCSGRPTRRWCRSTRPARGRWRTRSCSAASGGSWTIPRGGSGKLTDALVDLHRRARRDGAVRQAGACGCSSRAGAARAWRPRTATGTARARRSSRRSTSST